MEKGVDLSAATLMCNPEWRLREADILTLIRKEVKKYRSFVDVGANIGVFSLVANQCSVNSEIICIEANPKLIDAINNNITENGNHSNKITIINAAVSDTDGLVEFFENKNNEDGSIFNSSESTKSIMVPSCLLQDVCPKNRRSLVKIDIEGAEYRAIAGAPALLDSGNATFLIELHAWGDVQRKKYPIHLAILMYKHKYKIEKLGKSNFFGSHYLFERDASYRRTIALFKCLPLLLCKYVVWRLFPKRARDIEDFLRRLKTPSLFVAVTGVKKMGKAGSKRRRMRS